MEFIHWLTLHKDLLSIIIASAAVGISILSIMLTLISIRMQKRHFIKSIKPIATFLISDYENRISVSIKNSGIGPLIIDKFKAIESKGNYKDDIISLMPELPIGIYWSTFTSNFGGFAILPADSLILIEFKLKLDNPVEVDARDLIRKYLCQLEVELLYRDIYNNIMPKASKSLSWFARNLKEEIV
jgi:hypothetical protein